MGKTNDQIKNDKTQDIINGIDLWVGYWRHNLSRFCEEFLGIKLKLFQKILLWMMDNNTNFYYIASRG